MTLAKYVDAYLVAHDVADRTAEDYRWLAAQFSNWAGALGRLDVLSAETINRYLIWLRERGCTPATVRSRRTKVLLLWRASYRDGHTDNRPDADRIRRIRVPAPNPQGLTHEQTERLVAYCRANMRRRLRLVPVPAGDYLAALFLFLWSSGMRLGDALSMEYAWLGPTVTWRQSKTSTWHTAKLSPATLEAIERIRTPLRAMVWPRPGKSRTALYRMIRRAFAGAGLLGSSKYLRRGGATDVYRNGGDPAAYCGHVPGSRVAYRYYVSQEAQITPVSPTEL